MFLHSFGFFFSLGESGALLLPRFSASRCVNRGRLRTVHLAQKLTVERKGAIRGERLAAVKVPPLSYPFFFSAFKRSWDEGGRVGGHGPLEIEVRILAKSARGGFSCLPSHMSERLKGHD